MHKLCSFGRKCSFSITTLVLYLTLRGAHGSIGRASDSVARRRGFDIYLCFVVSFSKDTFTPKKVLVIPRKQCLHPTSHPLEKKVNLISNATYFQLPNCTMDASFEVLALDGSFHEEQAVRSGYQCNDCPYKSSYKQNLNRHKHTKHPMPLGTMSRQAVCFCAFLCVVLI